jgi:PAS domain S-box-containing protein
MRADREPSPTSTHEGAGRGLPRRARLLVAVVIAAGLLVVAIRVPAAFAWDREDLWSFAGLAAAISFVELFPLRFRHNTEIQYFSLTDALWAAGLLLLLGGAGGRDPNSIAVMTMAVGLGALVGQAVQRRALVKSAFNVGQWLIAITAAEAVFLALHPPGAAQPMAWLDAGLAMGVCFILNSGLTVSIIAAVESRPWTDVAGEHLGLNALHWIGNLALGVMVAVVWKRAPLAMPLLSVPLVLSYFAYRAWLMESRGRDRMRTLYEASLALTGPLDANLNVKPFLSVVCRLLDAQAAELVVVRGDAVTIHHEEGSESLVVGPGPGARQPQAYVRVRDGITPKVAVVGGPGDVRAVLALYRDEPLIESERSLLDALASQVRLRLVNQRLYSEILDERTGIADVIAQAPDGVFVLSPSDRIVSWNPAMELVTGRPAPEAVGRSWEEVFGPRNRAPQGEELAGADDGTILFVRSDGAERWIRCRRAPLRDRSGTESGSVITVRDVTGEVEREQLKANFVATVSHELRNPLTPLKGFIGTLLAGTGEDSPEARREYYTIMAKQVTRLERLISDLLEVSRIEAGHLPLETSDIDLTALVSDDVNTFARNNPERDVQLRAPAGAVLVQADPTRVQQVITNLLSNAMKYSLPETPVEITVAAAGEQAIVSVRDEGEGIAPEEHERIFDRFHRVEDGLARSQDGTGLGLYIAKRLVEAMGGRIWLVSSPGHGSTFSFSIPLLPHADPQGSQGDRPARSADPVGA